MTLTALASPELADSPCSVAECVEPVCKKASATVSRSGSSAGHRLRNGALVAGASRL